MNAVDYWTKSLNLLPHPEGGFYKETYRSSENIISAALPSRYAGDRNFSTAIYFLLRSEDRSVFHRIKSDELWHFYAGTTLLIYVLTNTGLTTFRLGPNPDLGDSFQVLVPANSWFGAVVEQSDSYSLCGCTVAPGFEFSDFELAERANLLREFPDREEIIRKLTH